MVVNRWSVRAKYIVNVDGSRACHDGLGIYIRLFVSDDIDNISVALVPFAQSPI